MARLFISYRRDDSQGFAGRLAQDLGRALGEHQVFSDVEIPPGLDFSAVLHQAIAASDALLVVIGRRWAAESSQGYPSRLFEPADWVRTEIEAALAQGKLIIPVLVGGASMPAADALPDSIRALTRLQALPMSDRHWQADLATLLQLLRTRLPQLPQQGAETAERSGTPADALGELTRVLSEQLAERRTSTTPAPTSRGQRWPAASGLGRRLLRALGGRLRGLLGGLTVLGALYLGLRLFGDAQTLAHLDQLEARLLIGWQRLQHWLAPL